MTERFRLIKGASSSGAHAHYTRSRAAPPAPRGAAAGALALGASSSSRLPPACAARRPPAGAAALKRPRVAASTPPTPAKRRRAAGAAAAAAGAVAGARPGAAYQCGRAARGGEASAGEQAPRVLWGGTATTSRIPRAHPAVPALPQLRVAQLQALGRGAGLGAKGSAAVPGGHEAKAEQTRSRLAPTHPAPPRPHARPQALFGAPTAAELEDFFGAAEAADVARGKERWGFDVESDAPCASTGRGGEWEWTRV